MIETVLHKGLVELLENGKTSRIDRRFWELILRRLDALDRASFPEEMNVPGFNYHALKGHNPKRYSVHVNGPWCITFEFERGKAKRVNFEQYH